MYSTYEHAYNIEQMRSSNSWRCGGISHKDCFHSSHGPRNSGCPMNNDHFLEAQVALRAVFFGSSVAGQERLAWPVTQGWPGGSACLCNIAMTTITTMTKGHI
jgi:hypothetical protein